MDWQGRRVVIMGLARQGRALLHALGDRGARIVVTDLKSREKLAQELSTVPGSVDVCLGSHPLSLLDETEAVFVSGGVPADLPFILEARNRGIRVLNDSQLFMEEVQAPVIGVTGSAGKSTTTSLIGHILKNHFSGTDTRVWVGGNIGNPLIGDLENIRANDVVVLELSSFQLELMDRSPHTAVMMNVTPNHLDRHKTMERYLEAKARIMKFQAEDDWTVLGWDDARIQSLSESVRGNIAGFGRSLQNVDGVFFDTESFYLRWNGSETMICNTEEVPLRGEHNLWNAAAAFIVCKIHGVPVHILGDAVASFHRLPHRLEELGEKRGLNWVNDSIATTPDRAAAAVRSFNEPLVVLAGGRDKKIPWEPFIKASHEHVRHVILFGEAAEKIQASIMADCRCDVSVVPSLEEAVLKASKEAQSGSVVLLTPGCSSFDAYTDFEARGAHFRELVAGL